MKERHSPSRTVAVSQIQVHAGRGSYLPRTPPSSRPEKTGVQNRLHTVGGNVCHSDYPGIHGSADNDHKVRSPENFQGQPISCWFPYPGLEEQ